MKFVDVKNDVAFRKIFGNDNRKESLISFLNAILDFEGNQRIVAVSIMNPYQLPDLKGGKVTIIDVKAKDQAGNNYIVEMQVADEEYFDKRVLYYASKSYTGQVRRADEYKKLKPVYFIGILDFGHTQNPHYISRNHVLDIKTGERTSKEMEFTYIELTKFKLKLHELKTLTEKWVYFIKNAESLEVLPDDINDAGLASAYQEANIQTWTQGELEAYDYAFMREAQGRAVVDKAVRVAVEEAVEKEKEEIIIEMHNDDLSIERITKIAKISIEQVLEIIKKHT
jgi:predicted transposase/invertase (TIGR01784 family)